MTCIFFILKAIYSTRRLSNPRINDWKLFDFCQKEFPLRPNLSYNRGRPNQAIILRIALCLAFDVFVEFPFCQSARYKIDTSHNLDWVMCAPCVIIEFEMDIQMFECLHFALTAKQTASGVWGRRHSQCILLFCLCSQKSEPENSRILLCYKFIEILIGTPKSTRRIVRTNTSVLLGLAINIMWIVPVESTPPAPLWWVACTPRFWM